MARAKNGFSADVAQAANAGRYGPPGSSFGSSPPRNFGRAFSAYSGSSGFRGVPSVAPRIFELPVPWRTNREKNSAVPQ